MNRSFGLDMDKHFRTGKKLIDGVFDAVSDCVRVQHRPLAGNIHGEVNKTLAPCRDRAA